MISSPGTVSSNRLPAPQGAHREILPWGEYQTHILVRKTLYPYPASSRGVLSCTSPSTSRFRLAREMSEGKAQGTFRRLMEILRSEEMYIVQPNTSQLEAVFGNAPLVMIREWQT